MSALEQQGSIQRGGHVGIGFGIQEPARGDLWGQKAASCFLNSSYKQTVSSALSISISLRLITGGSSSSVPQGRHKRTLSTCVAFVTMALTQSAVGQEALWR